MWIDHLCIVRESSAEAMDERRIGELLAPFIGGIPGRPGLVVDARPSTARKGPTATYRLLAALGMPMASPVTLSFARPDGVADALESLLTIAPEGALLLVTARHSGQSRFAACCLVSALPMTENSVPLPECPAAAEPGDAFTDLMLGLRARYGEALSSVPAQA